MTDEKRNLPASVAARLLNRAKQTGDDYQTLFANFCFERFLYRLGASTIRDRFVLKGAMLLRLWTDQPYRATRDLDLLRRGDGSFEAIREDIRTICATPVETDAVVFDANAVRIEAIRPEDEYAGTRTSLPARCGTVRLRLQIDMGLGDSVWPAPQPCAYPVLLDFPSPEVLAYPREAVVAEKFEAMVVLGDRNSRIKDFFDVYHLATHFEFDRATLAEAVRRTFTRRGTPIPVDDPIALTAEYWGDPSRPAQVRAFTRRAGLEVPPYWERNSRICWVRSCCRLFRTSVAANAALELGRPADRGRRLRERDDERRARCRSAAVQAVPGLQGLRGRVARRRSCALECKEGQAALRRSSGWS